MGHASNQIWLGGGSSFNGTNWIAKDPTPVLLGMSGGVLNFYSDSSQTAGSAYTPTARLTVDGNGNLVTAGNITVNPGMGFYIASDMRLKENIKTLKGLDLIEKLRGVSFDWKQGKKPSLGVIAQEVEKVIPGAVRSDVDGIKTVEYTQIIPPLIEAVKELKAENEKQAIENEKQKTEIKKQEAEILKLRKEIEQ